MSEALGLGERIEKARRNRRAWLAGGMFAAGLAAGIYTGATRGDSVIGPQTDWPAWLALGFALFWFAALILGGLWGTKATDEVELQSRYKAVAAAAAAYVLVYPIWFFLWKGGFVAEPDHRLLFILFMAALMVASLFYRFR